LKTRILAGLAGASLLATGLLIGSLGTASSATTHRTIRGSYSRHAYKKHRRYIDSNDDGSQYGFGDLIVARGALHRSGHAVGKVFDSCSIMDTRGPGRDQCVSTLNKSGGGTITFSSIPREDPSPGVTMDGAITGGTGRFSDARGNVSVHYGSHRVVYTFDVNLQ
jgi:hypothetical protein